MSRRSTMTRPWGEWRYKRFIKSWSRRNSGSSGSEKSHQKASIADMAAKVENDCRENVRKLAPLCPWHASQNGLHCSHENGEALKEVTQVGEQKVFIGDEKGVIQDMWGGRSSSRRDSLIVWDIVLTVWEAAGGEELASQPHSHSGEKRWDGGTRSSTLANFAEALWQYKTAAWSERRSLKAILTKAKNAKCRNYNWFFHYDFLEIMYSHLVPSFTYYVQYYTYSTFLTQLTCDEEGLHTICFD